MVVKDEFGRYYNVIDGVLYTPLGKEYMDYEDAKSKLNIKISKKSWEKICSDWKPSGKLIRNKNNRNR